MIKDVYSRKLVANEVARARHPARWSGKARNWSLESIVCLNPEREVVLRQASETA